MRYQVVLRNVRQNGRIEIKDGHKVEEATKTEYDSSILQKFGQSEQATDEIQNALAHPLSTIDDLTISGVTKPVTFATSVKAESATELSGLAKTQVLRSDFNLTIPNVPSVANVTDEVQLELQFAAKAE